MNDYFVFNPNSSNCDLFTEEGALCIKSFASLFFGNAMTSLIESSPHIIATSLSKPKAIPP